MIYRTTPLFLVALLTTVARADSKPLNRPGLPLRPEPVEVRLVDGSKLFLTLGEESLDITTAYGKLRIKLTDVQKIEFGIRPSPEAVKRIDVAMALLTSGEEKKTDAWLVLAEVKDFGYPTLLRLSRHPDRAVAAKAGQMLDVLRKAYPAERLRRIDHDVIHTES